MAMALPLLPAGVFCWSRPLRLPCGRASDPHERRCTDRPARLRLTHAAPADRQARAPAPAVVIGRGSGRPWREHFSELDAATLSRPDRDPDDLAAFDALVLSFDDLARTASDLRTGGAAPCLTFAS